MIERTGEITFQGKPLTLLGSAIELGGASPEFTVTANDLSDIPSSSYRNKVLVLSSVPSLDTPVCATQTRIFNQRATQLSEEVVVLTVSMDLPFAQKRFCGSEGIDRVVTASDYKYRAFGPAFGVLIKELSLLARAVFVVDRGGQVVYVEYVPEITEEPDYDAAFEAVKAAV